MAKTSNKTVWLIMAVLVLIAAQVAVLGFVVARSFSHATTVQAQQPKPRLNSERQNFPPPTARPLQPSSGRKSAVVQKAEPKQKPVGPRAGPPVFSKTSGIFTNAVTVELKAKSANATIRYTLDGSDPTESSTAYAAPIVIRDTRLVRAACFEKGLAPSISISHAYRMLDDDLLGFSSNLPLVVIDSFNQPISYVNYGGGSVRFIDTSGARASLLGEADFDGRIDLKRRGFTSLRFPKMSLTLKTRDDDGDKVKSPVFGLPEDSDWVLYAPYSDKTLIRDVLGYELSNQMGRYAPRTRLVEVFIHRSSGKLSYRDYAGVYVLAEKIKRSKERVNIAKLKPEDNAEPEISGGYILKRDHGAMKGGRNFGGNSPPRPSNDGVGFITPRGLHLFHVEPDEDELTEAQKKWVTRYFADFERALHGPKFADPMEGYAKYLDVDAFIDHFWLVELTKNVDAFRYSAYVHKARGGKITLGPAWDWNLSFGNADYYDAYETSEWYYENLRDSEISWIYRLKQDPEFMQRCIDRWGELRRDVIAPEKLLRRVDALRTQLQESQQRNFRKWPVLGRGIHPNYYVGPTYDAEINWMKIWIKDRIAWIDKQYPAAPKLSEKPGPLAAGTKLKLSVNAGEIYYTLDGTDPRARGGAKSKAAQKYTGPIAVDGNMKVTARVMRGGSWSAPATSSFSVGAGKQASAD
ncbi:MAG TPA: CotH kinase family protein [Candidatus Limnocylindria bacterium]|nr:CotH kinase family protein [Candidatus Limnocylindria bacterium]